MCHDLYTTRQAIEYWSNVTVHYYMCECVFTLSLLYIQCLYNIMIQANVQCHVSYDDYCNDRFTITLEVKVQTKTL